MINIVLVRHGNTFGPEDKVVWAGARTDLPLVEAGRVQANRLGQQFADAGYVPDRILTGPLLRTRQHADILADHVGLQDDVEIHQALCEIDYGRWEGLSTEEINALGGEAELTAWNTGAQWPPSPNWSPAEQDIEKNIHDLVHSLFKSLDGHGRALIVTSNGIMRFFARLCENPPPLAARKVRTGHHCQLVYNNGRLRLISWNQIPNTPLSSFKPN